MPEEHQSHQAGSPFTEELVATSKDELPSDLPAAIALACARAFWVRAAYVCRVRREWSADGRVQELLKTFVVPDPPLEERLTTGRQRVQLLESLPDSMLDGGISVLADMAVPNVKPFGICVYERN
jgi:hypothetical protein